MSDRTKYTMRDVARLAGVSTSTVSAVINGSVPVSPERQKLVRDAMKALDFHPDSIARSLRTGRSNAIGVVVPDITNAFYPEVIRGVEDAARNSGYAVLLCDSCESSEEEEKHLSTLFSRRVDGVLLACCANSGAYDTTVRRRFPIVFVDRIPMTGAGATVCTDNVQAAYDATRHLIELGHTRIAFLAGHLGLSTHHDRLEGFRKAMQESHLPILDEYLRSGDVQIDSGLAATRHLLALASPPTGVMVSNHKLLLGLLQGLDEKNVSVPKQISVLGFDDYLWNRYSNPRLTAVAQSTFEMGQRAFELLIEAIEHGENGVPDRQIRLAAELRVRESTAPPAAEPHLRSATHAGG